MNTVITESPFYLTIGAISPDAVKDLADHFNHLPESDYLDGEYRLRRYGVFQYANDKVNKLPHRAFTQSDEFNKFQGNVERDYQDITTACYESAGFAEMMLHYAEQSGLNDDTEIEIHQIRIRAKAGETVPVAPEGVHQDGYNRIGMFMVNYQNITGGALKVHTKKDSPAMTTCLLDPGEYILLNDARFWHDADDITCVDGANEGYYDLFVLTGTKS